jgi:hydrogenase nickel incorporation protein HypB
MGESIRMASSVHAANDAVARQNRDLFAGKRLTVLNMISSPGSGKTSILERMAKAWGRGLAVITGDIQTSLDADRLAAAGAAAVQIETGGACHLSALMVQRALAGIDLDKKRLLVIENVGNLVCPAAFDLGETMKIAVLSVAEGDEKVAKYPALFARAAAVIVSKTDLLPYVTFSADRVRNDCRRLNRGVRLFPLSCTTGEGFDAWMDYCEELTISSCSPEPS